MTGIAASTTSGPIPSPAMTATRWRELLKPGRPTAAHAIRPADVDLGAARRTFELARRRLAAVGTEIHFAAPGDAAAAVGALIRLQCVGPLFQLERGVRPRRAFAQRKRAAMR